MLLRVPVGPAARHSTPAREPRQTHAPIARPAPVPRLWFYSHLRHRLLYHQWIGTRYYSWGEEKRRRRSFLLLLRLREALLDGELGLWHLLVLQAMIFVALGAEIERCGAPKEPAVIGARRVIACFLPILFLCHFFRSRSWAKYAPRRYRERSIRVQINRSVTPDYQIKTYGKRNRKSDPNPKENQKHIWLGNPPESRTRSCKLRKEEMMDLWGWRRKYRKVFVKMCKKV